LVEIVGARSGGTQGGIVAPDGARSTFVVPLMATKAAASNKPPGLFTRDYLSTPWSRPNDQERRLQAYSPTVEHIGIFLSAIQQFAPKNLTGGWLDRISRDLVLTGDNQTVRKVEKSSSRAHIFKSDTDHLSVFIANPAGNLKVTFGTTPSEINDKAPILLSRAPPHVQQAAAAALKEMAVALAHRAA
jgi:hypothetical protein